MDQIKKLVKDTILAKSIVDEIEEINILNNKELIKKREKKQKVILVDLVLLILFILLIFLMIFKWQISSIMNGLFLCLVFFFIISLALITITYLMDKTIDLSNKSYIYQCSFLELDEEKFNYINDFLKSKSKTDDYILDIEKEENILYIDINDRKIILNEYFDYLDIPVNDYKKYKFVRFWFYEIYPQKTVAKKLERGILFRKEVFNGNYEQKINYDFEIRKGK